MKPELRDVLAECNWAACTCPYEWRPLGRLYGISMGNSWVRMTTAPDCSIHTESQP